MNDNDIAAGQVFDFIDSVATCKHMVLFYEEPEYAYKIEFRFLRGGLQKGHACIYTVHEEDEAKIVERRMKDNGIDVERFRSKNLLHILKVNNPMSHPEGELKGAEEIMASRIAPMLRNGTTTHIVSRLIPQVKTEKERMANVNIEHKYHSIFDNLNISLMCPYPVEDIQSELESDNGRASWMKGLLCNHHAVIYALKLSKGIALNLDPHMS